MKTRGASRSMMPVAISEPGNQRRSKPQQSRLINGLILLGCALSFWANLPGIGTTLQPLFLVCFLAAVVLAALQGRIVAVPLTVTELILYAAAVLSAVVAVCRSIEPCMLYSMVFLVTLVLISVLVRVVPLEEILNIGAVMMVLLLLSSVIFDRHNFMEALSFTILPRTGLFRYRPFENHPDLTGVIFGAGSILLARRAFVTRSVVERVIMFGATACAWLFLIAASARASVLALICATIIAVIKEWRPTKAVVMTTFGAILVAIVAAVTAIGGSALAYLEKMFEVNSRFRGLGSGASGRTESWSWSVQELVTHPLILFFGGSLRSSDDSIIGYDVTEDSYLTIFLDFGLFAGTAIILVYLYSPFRANALSNSSENEKRQLILVPAFFVFLLVESIFNRYLLAMGNPISLIAMVIVVSLSVRARMLAKLEIPRKPSRRSTRRAAKQSHAI
jgi:exopolysaccharide production protein ExoQ